MLTNTRLPLTLLLALLPSLHGRADTEALTLTNLRVEYEECPLGIDVTQPRFSWQMTADEGHDCEQTHYRLLVTSEMGDTLWDSGRTASGESLNIVYAGTPLAACTRYLWNVRTWDNKGGSEQASSWFETGLMSDDGAYAGWSGAKWIGGGDDDLVLYPHYLPVFRLGFSLRLDEGTQSERASFVYGANDHRLMDTAFNLHHLASQRDSSYIRLELDASGLAQGGEAMLRVYRAGYSPEDKPRQPLASFPIAHELLSGDNLYDWHRVSLSSNLGFTSLFFGEGQTEVGSLNLNPIGQGGDFTAFLMVGDVGVWLEAGQRTSFDSVEISNLRSPQNRLVAVRDLCQSFDGGERGLMTTLTPCGKAAPMLRTEFDALPKAIAKARLYVTARGIYDLYVNGERVGNDFFNPGLTLYSKTQLYQTFDVTQMLQAGANAIGARLGEGWWSGGATYMGEYWNYFGDRQSLLAKLVITYTDGERQVIMTDPRTWQFFGEGEVVYGSFFQGEVYDARREALTEGWAKPGFNAEGWKPAEEVRLDNTVSPVSDYSHFQIRGQTGQRVRQYCELRAQSVSEPRPGVFVYDMGQNMVGVPSVSFEGLAPGTVVRLRYAEVCYPDMPEYTQVKGCLMLENIRAAMAQDVYIAKGGSERFSPRFTSHGYRYVEITGIDRPLPLESVRGVVLSSVDRLASHYETSDERVNQLWRNIEWSTLGNMLSIPTDCPQRNERLGWMGDISVFSRTATYLADLPQFLRRFIGSVRDTQHEDGRFPDVAPIDVGFGGLLWGSAGITVPWECYRQYGDKALLEEHYEAMRRYVLYIKEHAMEGGLLVQSRAWGDLCDWLGLEDGRNDKSLVWEAYFIYDLGLMREMAAVLGHTNDAEWFSSLYEERKAHFNATYIDKETGKTRWSAFDAKREGELVDTQTSYALPLAFGIVDEDLLPKVAENLARAVERESTADDGSTCPPYSLMTGFVGTAWISKALSDIGRTDLAYRLLLNDAFPSWLYPVTQGATTIWERLNSFTAEAGFGGNNRMNSFNHYSFGAVGSWMLSHSLGIERCDSCPAFKHFLLKPEPDFGGGMTSARGYYCSMYGRIESAWRKEGGKVSYEFTVPCNTTATCVLPASSLKDVEGYKAIRKGKLPGVQFLHSSPKAVTLLLRSGTYKFSVRSR